MTTPDPNIWMVEYWLNLAITAHIKASSILEVKKQKDTGGLITPRAEVKTFFSGFTEHRNVVPVAGAVAQKPTTIGGVVTPAATWFDIGAGKIAFRVVTKREDDTQFHDRCVGMIRFMMQLIFATPGYTPGVSPGLPQTISDRMPYHRIARMMDTGATPSFVNNEHQDITALSFDFTIQIRPEKLPTSN